MIPTPFETIHTDQLSIACDGDAGPSGHPRVYLHMDVEHHAVTCPYCSRTYLYRPLNAGLPSERALAVPTTGVPTTSLDLEKAH